MLRTRGLTCVRATVRLMRSQSSIQPLALLSSRRTSWCSPRPSCPRVDIGLTRVCTPGRHDSPFLGAAGPSRGLCAAPERDVSPKIQALVDQISELTLLEASELTDALKVCVCRPFARSRAATSRRPYPPLANHREVRGDLFFCVVMLH